MYFGHYLSTYGQYKDNIIMKLLKYYLSIWLIIESYNHIFDKYGPYYRYIMVVQ